MVKKDTIMKRLLPLALIGVLSSCSPLLLPDYGTLLLGISSSQMGVRTIVPDIDMRIATYSVSGVGPSGSGFEDTGLPVATTSFSRSGLRAGSWTVTVDAFNTANDYIGSGSVSLFIATRQVASAVALVRPLAGVGVLEISVEWPAGEVTNPRVEGSLRAIPNGASEAVPFEHVGNTAAYTYSQLSAGYYSLSVQLLDGDDLLAGVVEAVRMVSGQTTRAAFTLEPGTGGVGLVIAPDMDEPIGITFSGGQATLASGADMTITATPDRSVDSYAWYLNGSLLPGQTSSSLTIGSELAPGMYRLDVLVVRDSVASTAAHVFAVTPLITYLSQSRYVRVDCQGSADRRDATGFEDFDETISCDFAVAAMPEDHTDTYVATATQTSSLSHHRIAAVGNASDAGPFYAVEDYAQEAESGFRIEFTLNQRSEITLSGELTSNYDTGGTNVSVVLAEIMFRNDIPVYEAQTDLMDGYGPPIIITETFSLNAGEYMLWVSAAASGAYWADQDCPYCGVGGGGAASYSIELTAVPAP